MQTMYEHVHVFNTRFTHALLLVVVEVVVVVVVIVVVVVVVEELAVEAERNLLHNYRLCVRKHCHIWIRIVAMFYAPLFTNN
jgi:hypothetical protein